MVDLRGTAIPVKELADDTLLDRALAAEALSELGFKTTPRTLATQASLGSGPPYLKFGNRALYRWRDLKSWAENRLEPGRPSAGETTNVLMRRLVGG
jgi:hypothetical protein